MDALLSNSNGYAYSWANVVIPVLEKMGHQPYEALPDRTFTALLEESTFTLHRQRVSGVVYRDSYFRRSVAAIAIYGPTNEAFY